MILRIFSNDNIYVYKDIDKTFFRRCCSGGMKYLQFDISTQHALYPHLVEEVRVEYDGDYYIVKGINERSKAKISTINCELDLDGLDNDQFTKTFTTESFYNVCREILQGTGWQIVDAELVSKRTTLEVNDSTPRQILEKCMNSTAYNTCYEFDTKNKIIYSIKPYNNTTPTGTYFTDELNLNDLNYKGSSSSLVTKLYAYGKDGLSIASVNGGKEYIENHSYTERVITSVWRDERYTDPQSLKDDAEVKLNTLANPERSYTLKVVDLAKAMSRIYGKILAYELYDIVTLIDRNRKTKTDMRIVETCEYPADDTLNTVSISNVAGRVIGKIATLENKFTQLDAQQLHDRTKINEIKQDLDSTVLHISEAWANSVNESLFTQTAEGLFLQVDKIVGTNRWSTLLQQSANDIKIAWNNISKYIQFESGELCIYDSAIESIQKLRSKFNESGNHFYRDGYYVGKIGTNEWNSNNKHKGLVFDLDVQGKYMAFAQKTSESSSAYTTMLCFSRENSIYSNYGLHLGCDFYGHNYTIHDVYLDGVSVKYNSQNKAGFTGEIPIVTNVSITPKSDGGISWNISDTKLRVSNGIIVGYWT